MSHQSELISTDIGAYLEQHKNKELLRFLTCGSVDDGKSTLIGRLLHDSKMVYEDQLATIAKDSVKSGTTGDNMDLALLVDGLQAEREQGITIDVAYRYFSTSNRKFIIADTPGHEQYTRNMATGASTCDLAIILIDAKRGVQTQTRRHSIITSLLGIKHIIVAINKMDLINYDKSTYNKIVSDYKDAVKELDANDIQFIPISALNGDNVVLNSDKISWYKGQTLMQILETIKIVSDMNLQNFRFPVQYVNRPSHEFRGYCGTITSGLIQKGSKITVLPSGKSSKIKSIITHDGELKKAFSSMAVTLTLEDEIDISRGDMIVCTDDLPSLGDSFTAKIVWMSEQVLTPNKQYYIKLGTRTTNASISSINYRIDVNTLTKTKVKQLHANEIGNCAVALNMPVAFDPYSLCKRTGSFIIIDRLTNITVGAGMIISKTDDSKIIPVTNNDRASRYSQKPIIFWLTGKKKQQIAQKIERKLFDLGHLCVLLDMEKDKQLIDVKTINYLSKKAGMICLCTVDDPLIEDDQDNKILNCEQNSYKELFEKIQIKAQLK